MSLRLELVEAVSEVAAEEYTELEGPEAYPFLRREWLAALETSGCVGAKEGWLPRHLVLRRGGRGSAGGELVAFCPAYVKLHSMGEFVFDQAWAEFAERRLGARYYPKLILAVPFTPATGPRLLLRRGLNDQERGELLALLGEQLPQLAERLGVGSVHVLFPDEPQAAALVEAGHQLRLGVQYQFHNPGLADFEAFLATFRAKRRAAIRRERREREARGLALKSVSGADLSPELAPLLHALYLTTVDKYVWGRRYLRLEFFEEVLRAMPEALHVVLAERGPVEGPVQPERVVAGAINLLGAHALYGRYWGAFETVPFLHFDVCLYEGVSETIRLGRARFEPGAGGEHKESRGLALTLTRSVHHLADPRLATAVADYLARERDAVLAAVAARGSDASACVAPGSD